MKIYVDADACPAPVKEIVVRAAQRLAMSAIFVANRSIRLPPSPHVSTVRVGMGLDVADGYIAKAAEAGDLAITADIPLAAALVERGAIVLDPRGTVYSAENIGEALALRNFHHELREGGAVTGGPSGFGPREARSFAAAFDRELSRATRSGPGQRRP
ncbi:MAG: YaiI/YqxD family protein [Anaeromyxobacteraceae bacterium]